MAVFNDALRDETTRQEISPISLMNRILRESVEYDRFVYHFKISRISPTIMTVLLNDLSNEAVQRICDQDEKIAFAGVSSALGLLFTSETVMFIQRFRVSHAFYLYSRVIDSEFFF